jgi:2-C-methyl-D-erythritol 2,4-cyclodiphosphate synthase
MRIGYGYDCHRLIEGDGIFLGGVNIPYDRVFAAHSDGDVVLHALIDALLGAMGQSDIGEHFPSTQAEYQDISSMLLLRNVHEMLIKKNYLINNIDMTIIAEAPNLSQYKPKMAKNIAQALSLSINNVSVKAKTNERMGALGRHEGIAVHCVVLIREK